jgi:hypothetical protein
MSKRSSDYCEALGVNNVQLERAATERAIRELPSAGAGS